MSMAQDQPTDAELLALTRSDGTAFGVFYRRHVHAVLGFVVRRVGNAEAGADLTAEVFATALIQAESYAPERGEASSWLYGIANNKVLSYQRSGAIESRARHRLGIASLALTDEGIERVERLASLDVEARVLHEAMDDLPDDQREALLARVVDERSYAEIAHDSDVSALLARKRVSRALHALRNRLGAST